MSKNKTVATMCKVAFPVLLIAIMILQGCDTDGDAGDTKIDFQWRYDTLRYMNKSQGVVVNRLWGADRNSLYAIVSFPEKDMLMKLSNDRFVPVYLDPNRMNYLPDSVDNVRDVDGTGSSNVWVVGMRLSALGYKFKDSSFVAKWNGTQWKEYDLEAGFALYTVAAVDEQTFFAGGHAAGILYYASGVEQFIPFPVDIVGTPHESIFCSDMYYTEGVLYASGYIREPSGEYKCFRVRYSRDGMVSHGLVGLVEDVPARWGFWRSENGTLYSLGTESVFKGAADTWETVYVHSNNIRGIHGTTNRNYWIVGVDLCAQFVDGKVYHHQAAPATDQAAQYNRIWTDGDVVVIAYTETLSPVGDIILFGY